jgi:hypothetical protein
MVSVYGAFRFTGVNCLSIEPMVLQLTNDTSSLMINSIGPYKEQDEEIHHVRDEFGRRLKAALFGFRDLYLNWFFIYLLKVFLSTAYMIYRMSADSAASVRRLIFKPANESSLSLIQSASR